MADLKSSMQFHFDTTKGELLEVDTNWSQVYVVIDDNTKTLIDDHKNLYAKVRASENNSVNNLWIDGLLKTQGKDWHGSEAKIKQLTKKKELKTLRLNVLKEWVKNNEMTLRRKEQL